MDDRQLFIGNLCHVTIESLRAYCEKYGTVTDLSLIRDKDNNIYHCFAFLTFQTARSATQFMQKRPHLINDIQVFVKRALSRAKASIPERLVVTNRLVVPNSTKYDRQKLRNYLQKFGPIKNFDYEKGFIDYDDYDVVDRIIIARPHRIENREIFLTKFIPTQPEDIEEQTAVDDDDDEEDYKVKYQILDKQFEEYKKSKERELNLMKKELEKCKEDLSDITQIKLDKLIKNQQIFHNQLLLRLFPDCDAVHAQMCDDFLRSTPNKKRKPIGIPPIVHE